MNFKYAILSSIIFSFFLTIIGALIALSDSSSEPGIITKIAGWNFFLGLTLINAGWLPACKDCELAVLLYVLTYGLIIGIIGYSLLIFGGSVLLRKFRTNRKLAA